MRDHAEADYRSRLHATRTNIGWTDVREEILADFTGDALADPRFLETLATRNPSKFQQFLYTVVGWLKSVAAKLSKAGLGSSRWFDEVDELRGHLAEVLNAYRSRRAGAIGDVEFPPWSY